MPNTCNRTASLTRRKCGYQHKTTPSSIDNDKEKSNKMFTTNLITETVEMETNNEEQVQRSIQCNNNSNNNICNITNHTDDLKISTEMPIMNVNCQ